MTKQEIIEKTKKLVIAGDSRLADRNYRIKIPTLEKFKLAEDMIGIARKIELFNN